MRSELKISLPIKNLQDLEKQNNFKSKLAKLATGFLEKYYGANLLLDIPPALYETDSKLFSAISTAEKLQAIGIIGKIIKSPKFYDEPFFHRFSITMQKMNLGSSGGDFFNEESALWKAIGEATERSLWKTNDHLLQNIQHLPYAKIKSKALNIFKLAGFSEEQKKSCNWMNFDQNAVFGWIPAISLTGHAPHKNIFCPAQLINSSYFNRNVKGTGIGNDKEPLLRHCITTGAATTSGPLEEAIVKGILEIIERDAYIISYLNKLSPPVLDFEHLSFQDEDLEKVYKMFKRYGLEVYLVKLPTDFSASIVSAIILDRSGNGPAFAIGNSAKLDLKSAILGALTEAFSIRMYLKKNWDIKKESPLPDLKKFNMIDRMIYWARPENMPRLDFMTQGEKIKLNLETEENFFNTQEKTDGEKYYKDKLQLLIKELGDKKYEACYVELSTPAVKKIGLRSVQVIIPELQPMHLDEELPYLGGKRLHEVPKKTGYLPAETLCQEPHPFS